MLGAGHVGVYYIIVIPLVDALTPPMPTTHALGPPSSLWQRPLEQNLPQLSHVSLLPHATSAGTSNVTSDA